MCHAGSRRRAFTHGFHYRWTVDRWACHMVCSVYVYVYVYGILFQILKCCVHGPHKDPLIISISEQITSISLSVQLNVHCVYVNERVECRSHPSITACWENHLSYPKEAGAA